ncbi:MAG: hypothetical protein KKA99_00620 [Gammaproteobacteria bacterium]|nr:hypothetical protein [Gammaproteobacteria bacterium]MBU1629402.1 hypothetical protein [Gammaproteobacteria bacterium]MBU1926200.1 hypothetical protein [Gammaproteobacteria bacterium]
MNNPKSSISEIKRKKSDRTRPISKIEHKKQLEKRQSLQMLISAGHEASKAGVLGQRMPEEQTPEGNEAPAEEMSQIKEHPWLSQLPVGCNDPALSKWIKNNSHWKTVLQQYPELAPPELRLLAEAKKVHTPLPVLVRS